MLATTLVLTAPYRAANHAAAACGLSAQLLSRITGTVLLVAGERHNMPTEQLNKINIGLNLKFNKKNLEVAGYTRRCKVTNAWLYSERCIELVQAYEKQFPEVFDCLGSGQHSRDVYFESDIYPQDLGKNKAQDIAQWIKAQPHSRAARRECGSEALEPEEMKALADDLDKQIAALKEKEKKPELHSGNLCPDPRADFRLYDRVVCVAAHVTAPLAAAGTVVAVIAPAAANTVRLSDKLNADNSYLNSATDLLKSLLKISDDPEAKKSKVRGPPPPQNWRKENASLGNNNRQPVFSNYKNQAPLPPYPTFGQPYQGPGPSQIPFPQFQNPHFQQRNQSYNMPRNQGPHNRSFEQPHNRSFEQPHNRSFDQPHNRSFEQPQNFPKHLPSVGAVGPNITLGPSWNQPNNPANSQNMRSPNANRPLPQTGNDKVSNPFVPLQVQTR
ncbi:hypothetical protein HF086_012704 [Spodoptera exigua]|uniref:Exoribonuclease Xrn1 D2/D3 domain-containing protein n=1 Tax=Spodoptera exigua TaxID=7107 RepID=A0A922MC68_SPOEX|nr:hypothetical protein HF086_012704 [Spodoptera exigua]